jgi:hypothetical protein
MPRRRSLTELAVRGRGVAGCGKGPDRLTSCPTMIYRRLNRCAGAGGSATNRLTGSLFPATCLRNTSSAGPQSIPRAATLSHSTLSRSKVIVPIVNCRRARIWTGSLRRSSVSQTSKRPGRRYKALLNR